MVMNRLRRGVGQFGLSTVSSVSVPMMGRSIPLGDLSRMLLVWWTTFFLGWGICLTWAMIAGPAVLLLRNRNLQRLKEPVARLAGWPSLAVVIAARDEQDQIETTLRTLLASDYPRLSVIAVNDRSTDQTGAVMDRIAGEDARVRVVHITELPEGWLGKNHAMQTGAAAAQCDFVLFTDGDILFAPDALRRAVQYAAGSQLDHLCLLPNMISGSYWENALVSYFGLIFTVGTQPWLVPTSFRRAYVGVGAFNMVRKSAYEAVGGYEPIRFDVLDDVKLGKLLKGSGYRQDVLLAGDLVRVRWQPSAWGVIRGLEKNAFASLNYSVMQLLGVTAFTFAMVFLPFIAIVAAPDVRASGYAAALAVAHFLYAYLACVFGGTWTLFPMFPWAAAAMLFAFWRSALITLRQNGVRWRDTFYPLKALREGLYR